MLSPNLAVRISVLSLLPCVLLGAGCQEPPPGPGPRPVEEDPTTRAVGDTDFVSADGYAGQPTRGDGAPSEGSDSDGSPEPGAPADDDGARTVEEGDIYRLLGDGLIANLNAYRGLQLIDIHDVNAPTILGRLQISGDPVEMYVDGTRVYILMNNWFGYWGVREEVASLSAESGGVIAAVDIADPSNPILLDQAFVSGTISTSRLTRGNVSRALYVAASRYDSVETGSGAANDAISSSGARTVVKSFDLSAGTIAERGELDLGGWVTDIQATSRALLVARHDWSVSDSSTPNGSRVALIDISSPDGVMVQGSEVQVAGYVENQFRMSLEGDILRVASGSSWGSTNTNHIETFQAANLSEVTAADHVTFGDGEQLYATIFLADRAFAVTYLRVDPFHAFSIKPDGSITEESEFVVSGWNDFFKPTLDDTRLIGVGTDDVDGRTMSVSLYDITNLTNRVPLVARASVDSVSSWSLASWDHRAFSVVEDAVQVTNSDGTVETGLVLLPFTGTDATSSRMSSAVQVFTYSSSSLTRRGLMNHGTLVNRSFQAESGITVNLSDAEMSLFGTSNPDSPEEYGRLELAPDFSDILVFGDHAARVNREAGWYDNWTAAADDASPSHVDIIPLSEDPDRAEPVARIEVPARAALYAAGTTLVAISTRVADGSVSPPVLESRVVAWDLANPTVPVEMGDFTTDRLASSGEQIAAGGLDCADCGGYGGWYGGFSRPDAVTTGKAVAILKRTPHQEVLGQIRQCQTYSTEAFTCDATGMTCTFVNGWVNCYGPPDEASQCFGGFQRCTTTREGDAQTQSCEDINVDETDTETSCSVYDDIRYWTSFSIEVIDVRGEPESCLRLSWTSRTKA